MKKHAIFAATLSALAMVAVSCSDDEVISQSTPDTINFAVTAGKASRAAATTTNTIDNFKVWAFTGGKTYMDGTEVTRATSGTAWTYDSPKYWPETDVDFIAVSPVGAQGVSVADDAKTIGYTVVDAADEDLLYSAAYAEKKTDHQSTPVDLNFRHALSQVVFTVSKTSDASFDVKVKGITVDGVANSGTLTWATETTGSNITATDQDTQTGATWGTWADVTGTASYPVATTATDGQAVTETATAFGTDGALFLMPQTLNEWAVKADDGTVTFPGTARLLINCQIVDTETGVQLWPATEGEYADVAVSLTNPTNDKYSTGTSDTTHNAWMQGKKYIYNLVFGHGAGYTPGPDPKPVLVPISFNITVDEFQDGGSSDTPYQVVM